MKELLEVLSAPYREKFISKWTRALELSNALPLRLSLLRDLSLELHKMESQKVLPENTGTRAKILEKRIQDLKSHDSLELPVERLFSTDKPSVIAAKRRSQTNKAENLQRILPIEKLNRSDREWEKLIAEEAFSREWSFWIAECSIEAKNAESFHRDLVEAIWPDGICLYVENQDSDTPLKSPLIWKGVWNILFSPGSDSPNEIVKRRSFSVPVKWKCLFPENS